MALQLPALANSVEQNSQVETRSEVTAYTLRRVPDPPAGNEVDQLPRQVDVIAMV